VEVTVKKLRKPAIVYILHFCHSRYRCGKCCQVLATTPFPQISLSWGVVLSQSTFHLVLIWTVIFIRTFHMQRLWRIADICSSQCSVILS